MRLPRRKGAHAKTRRDAATEAQMAHAKTRRREGRDRRGGEMPGELVMVANWPIGELEHWQIASLEHWRIGTLPHRQIAPLSHWQIASLPHWHIGELTHCPIASLPHWQIASLPHWQIASLPHHSFTPAFTKYTPSRITPTITNCMGSSVSPSSRPQPMATMGIR